MIHHAAHAPLLVLLAIAVLYVIQLPAMARGPARWQLVVYWIGAVLVFAALVLALLA